MEALQLQRGIFSKGEQDKKGNEGKEGLLMLASPSLTFTFYKELYSIGIFVCLFLHISSSFIGAY